MWSSKKYSAADYFRCITLSIALIFLYTNSAFAQGENELVFERISVDEGLSQSTVNCILQDNYGFLWFGTEYGLNRYDGYEYTIFSHIPFEPNSLIDNVVNDIVLDHQNNLWIATNDGLSKYNIDSGKFTNYQHCHSDSTSLPNNRINDIFLDKDNIIWLASELLGLIRFDPKTEKCRFFPFTDPEIIGAASYGVSSICQGPEDDLFAGTFDCGVVRFDPQDESYRFYSHDPENPNSLSNNMVWKTFADLRGNLWISAGFEGLDKYDADFDDFTKLNIYTVAAFKGQDAAVSTMYQFNADLVFIGTEIGDVLTLNTATMDLFDHLEKTSDAKELKGKTIRSIFVDESSVLWVGTEDGLYKCDLKSRKFRHLTFEPDNPNGLSYPDIWSIFEDSRGVIWIGTNGDGLNLFNPYSETFRKNYSLKGAQFDLNSNIVIAIAEDSFGNIWIGTSDGVSVFNRATEKYRLFRNNPDDPHSLSGNIIMTLFNDRKGNMWVGTYNGGLNRFNTTEGDFTRYMNDPDNPYSISDNRVSAIKEDEKGNLWIGTSGGGLDRFSPETDKFAHYKLDSKNPETISDNSILDIMIDSRGVLWIGTYNGGLNKLDRYSGKFKHFTVNDGLPNNTVYGILEDNNGYLWMSTNNGLARFNPSSENFVSFGVSDGLQSKEFNAGAFCKASDGRLYFGGINGFNSFYPNRIIKISFQPPVVFTDLRVMGKSLEFDRSLLKKEGIKLDYRDNYFTIGFAALDYTAPHKNQYAYMLQGLTDDWIDSGTQRFASFANLAPGEYTLKVKATNSDGVWNEDYAQLKLNIIPPYWKTGWFRLVVALAGFGILYGIYAYRVGSIKRKEIVLQREVDRRTREIAKKTQELQHVNLVQTELLDEREELISELKNALLEIKKLSGLIPICASCKKVRDDTGYWQQVETFMESHSEAEFSHSLCPDCLKKIYPVYFDEKYTKNGELRADDDETASDSS